MENKGNSQPTIERWTARRKADLASKIIKGQKTIVDAAREYDLKQSEIQKWIETFLEYGRQGLRANPRNAESAYEVYPLYDFVPIAEKLKLENAREKR